MVEAIKYIMLTKVFLLTPLLLICATCSSVLISASKRNNRIASKRASSTVRLEAN